MDSSIDVLVVLPQDDGAVCKLVLTMSDSSVVTVCCKANDTYVVGSDDPVLDARAAVGKIKGRIPPPRSHPFAFLLFG